MASSIFLLSCRSLNGQPMLPIQRAHNFFLACPHGLHSNNIIDFGKAIFARLSEQHHVVLLLMRGTKCVATQHPVLWHWAVPLLPISSFTSFIAFYIFTSSVVILLFGHCLDLLARARDKEWLRRAAQPFIFGVDGINTIAATVPVRSDLKVSRLCVHVDDRCFPNHIL